LFTVWVSGWTGKFVRTTDEGNHHINNDIHVSQLMGLRRAADPLHMGAAGAK